MNSTCKVSLFKMGSSERQNVAVELRLHCTYLILHLFEGDLERKVWLGWKVGTCTLINVFFHALIVGNEIQILNLAREVFCFCLKKKEK